MTRNIDRSLVNRYLSETELALRNVTRQLQTARSISDVTRLARTVRVVRVVGGYRFVRSAVEYTEADLAWFRKPLGGAK